MAKKILRKLAMGPAVVVSAIVVLLLSLLGLINFTPPSLDESSSDARQEPIQETTSDTNALVTIESSSSRQSDERPEAGKLEPMDVVDVLIDGDAYWVGIGRQDGELQREKRTIGEITRASQECEGNETGVKVRVTRTFHATAQAEQALLAAFTEAGLTGDEIDRRRTLVSRPTAREQ